MLRQGRHKYVRFRAAPPLASDLAADPSEQNNLLRQPDTIPEAVARLAAHADASIDFDEIERERVERDADLAQRYRLDVERVPGNVYTMPDGRLVRADDALYAPGEIAPSWRRHSARTGRGRMSGGRLGEAVRLEAGGWRLEAGGC